MTYTENDLRSALLLLEQRTPEVAESIGVQASDGPGHRRGPARWIGPVLAAAVVVVIAGAALLTNAGPERSLQPATVWNSSPPSYSTRYQFGPSSMPGLELNFATLTPTVQSYQFDTAGRAFADQSFFLYAFEPTPAVRAQIARLTPTKVGAVTGGYGTSAVTGHGILQALFAPAPKAKYGTTPAPDESVVAWPLDNTHWAALTPFHDGGKQTMPASELVSRAASVVPSTDDHAAAVRVGYLPPSLRFAAAMTQPPTHMQLDQRTPAGQVDPTNVANGSIGAAGKSARTLAFAARTLPALDLDTTQTTLNIDTISDPLSPLSTTAPNPMAGSNLFGGPWTRTTVRGHLAWIAPHAVLIQWGKIQVGVSSSRASNDTTSALLSRKELLKVANSLTVPHDTTWSNGYPLLTSVPSGAFS